MKNIKNEFINLIINPLAKKSYLDIKNLYDESSDEFNFYQEIIKDIENENSSNSSFPE